MLNPDFRDMLSALCDQQVEFMVVGAYALAAHGLPRATGDIDLWIRRSDDNAPRVWRAIANFGRNHLLQNKRATGRPKDKADVTWLESGES